MSLGQFFLGLVAILIATVVYRWQKALDRETAVQAELRALYAKYLAATSIAFFSQPYKDAEYDAKKLGDFFGISSVEQEVYILRDQICLLAPSDVVTRVIECDRKFREWKMSFPEFGETDQQKCDDARSKSVAFRAERRLLMTAMRSSLEKQRQFDVLGAAKRLGSEKK